MVWKLTIPRFLIWTGAILIVLELIANLYNGFGLVIRLGPSHVAGFNFGTEISILVSSVYEGGVLIGLGKIIEVLQKKESMQKNDMMRKNEGLQKGNSRIE